MNTTLKAIAAALLITTSATATAWGPLSNSPFNNNSNGFADTFSDMASDFMGEMDMDMDMDITFRMKARGNSQANANSRYYGYGYNQYNPYYGYAPYGYAPVAPTAAPEVAK